jgi:uncharacterized membrane protein YbhN (UPF0104 family)
MGDDATGTERDAAAVARPVVAPVGTVDDATDAGTAGIAGTGPTESESDVPVGGRAVRRNRWSGGAWRSILFAPIGDGQRRRRGSDGIRVGVALLVILVCWLATKVNASSERAFIDIVTPPPDGVRWLVTTVWWIGSVGLTVVVVVLALVSRRWAVLRDCLLSGVGAALVWVVSTHLLGVSGGRPSSGAPAGFNTDFPVVRVAATVAVATAALPYLSRWVQRGIRITLLLLALSAVVSQSGLPVSVLASLAVGTLCTAVVHLVFGSPLGLVSADEAAMLVEDLGIHVSDLTAAPDQEWGVGRFVARAQVGTIDVAVYGRDASDAQLLAKTARFALYRDSGPTLTLTRRQQVEHEAYLTLLADRAGVRVARVLAAGPAGPARDALLVTSPPPGRRLAELTLYILPAVPEDDATADTATADGTTADTATAAGTTVEASTGGSTTIAAPAADGMTPAMLSAPSGDDGAPPGDPALDADALDDLFTQVRRLRAAGIAHGALSVETILVDDGGRCGLVDMRAATTVASQEQLDRDVASALAAAAMVAGPEATVASAARILPTDAVVGALPFLQKAALNPVAGRSLRKKKGLLTALREQGAAAGGVEVPKLIEPRRISWVDLALVAGTLIGGWALIGVLVNVTKSWSTISGARWGWVAASFVLAQAVYPALALTTVGSVTDTMPYGRTTVLEVANTFVSLAGGTMGALATRVRYFQQQGYDATLAVSSGVLVSTASWIVKGGLFLIAIPIALSQFHFGAPDSTGGGSGSSTANLVWLLVIAIVVIGVAVGLLLAVPRWRRLAAARLRPKASEVWGHLKVLSTHPRNLFEIFGGEILGQLLVAMALGTSLHAFDEHLSLAALLIVLTLGSMLGGISPVPGGMGVVEAGMIIGLTAAGVPESQAVAAVFVQRLFTAYLPPIWGWFCLVWMRKREYL